MNGELIDHVIPIVHVVLAQVRRSPAQKREAHIPRTWRRRRCHDERGDAEVHDTLSENREVLWPRDAWLPSLDAIEAARFHG